MDWLQNITITCFAASYAVVFVLEISRVFFDLSFRKVIRIGFTAAGIFAHVVYLIRQFQLELDSTGIWLGSWSSWCLTASCVVAAAYLWISIRQPKSVIGLFLIPVAMALIAAGIRLGSENQFSVGRAKTVWNSIHGSALLLGTAVVALGFVFGLVYVVQASRLKRKLPQSRHFRLPSLEWLQRSGEYSLVVSTILLAVGLISGIAINLIRQKSGVSDSAGAIAWTDPVVWSSGILFSWLLAVSVFNFCYQPARQGRKVAYLVMTSFVFLVLELAIVWWVGHATSDPANVKSETRLIDSDPKADALVIGEDLR